MTASSGTDTSESDPSPDRDPVAPQGAATPDDDNPPSDDGGQTVAWDLPIRTFAGVRDPSSKAVGAGIMLASITTAFRLDLIMKEAIADAAVILGTLVSAYGPKAQLFLLNIRNERMAQTHLDKLQRLANAYPNDQDLQMKASAARGILADGWLSRIRRTIKAETAAPSKVPGKPPAKPKPRI